MSVFAANAVIVAVAVAYVLAVIFAVYTILIIGPYLYRDSWEDGDPSEMEWHFLVPCRDEEAVVGGTSTYLLETFPDAEVWIIDDDSEDRTRDIVREIRETNPRLHLVERRRPNARIGKAQALNFAWARVKKTILERGEDLHNAAVIVVDADGRPSANMLHVLAGEGGFGDPEVSLVQTEVRMRNRTDKRPVPDGDWLAQIVGRLFVRMQDIEFRGPISATQMTRRQTNTVNAGGNGQAARASALARINQGNGPWGESLVEDLELGLHILFDGGKNAYTTDAWVEQEALYSLSRYLTQRTRWSRGTMQCGEYLPQVWSTPQITNLGASEMTLFLLQPWIQLVGSLVFPVPFLAFFYGIAYVPNFLQAFAAAGGWYLLGIILIIGLVEFAIWGVLYWLKCSRESPWPMAIIWGISYLGYVFINYPVVWSAFAQFVSGKEGWAKTRRNAEIADQTAHIARFD